MWLKLLWVLRRSLDHFPSTQLVRSGQQLPPEFLRTAVARKVMAQPELQLPHVSFTRGLGADLSRLVPVGLCYNESYYG